jgi:hypothetical protein
LVVKTGGLPEAQSADISVTGSGAIDLSGAAALTTLATGAPADPAVIGELLKSLKLTQVIDAVIKAGGTEQKGKFEARIVDGTLYFVSDPATAGTWQKVDLQKAIAAGQSQMSGLPGAGGAGNANPLNDPATNAALSALTSDPKFLQLFADTSKYVVVETTDGPEVAGAATKKIQIGLNLKGLLEILTSDDALPTLKALLETQGTKLEDAQFKQQVALIKSQLAAFAPTFEATTIAAYWLVDPAAKSFSGFGLTIATKLDPNAAALVNPTATGEVTINIDFLVTISKVGEDVAVEPVADAVEVPLS